MGKVFFQGTLGMTLHSNLETCLGRRDALMMSNSVALPSEGARCCIRSLQLCIKG